LGKLKVTFMFVIPLNLAEMSEALPKMTLTMKRNRGCQRKYKNWRNSEIESFAGCRTKSNT
jgi:hypothetical protein